jgi:DNA ligase-1
MRDFARLYAALDETTKTSEKTAALVQYFRTASPEDAAWAVYFLCGRKPKQVVPAKRLREWAGAAIGLADWLVEECYHTVGDAAETVALLLPPPTATTTQSLAYWVRERLLPLRQQGEAEQRQAMLDAWAELDPTQRLVWNKLITGGFRVGVSQQLVTRALAEIAQVEPATIAQRLMGDWQPSAAAYQALIGTASDPTDPSRPYPFMLAHALEPIHAAERPPWYQSVRFIRSKPCSDQSAIGKRSGNGTASAPN